MKTDDVLKKALALIASTERALAVGVRHYNRAGALLMTSQEVLLCLRDEGEITLEDPDRRAPWLHE